jgi:hypothetical protein
VSCVRCNRAIPVSAKVFGIQNEIKSGEQNVPHAFVARCQMCENESVYEIKDLKRFDGEPPKRMGRSKRRRAAGAS